VTTTPHHPPEPTGSWPVPERTTLVNAQILVFLGAFRPAG
jgi:hypothetical protein